MKNIIDYREYPRGINSQKVGINTVEPVMILHWLRETGILTPPYYLHINQGKAEIGWHAKGQIALLDGEGVDDWGAAIKRIGDQAATIDNKAFGYLGFDAWDSEQGLAPDKSATFPLVQFFIPEHRICIHDGRVDYIGPDASILDWVLQAPAMPLPWQIRPSYPDVEFSEHDFMQKVSAAKQSLSGNIAKVVLSRYLGFAYDADLLTLFKEYCLQQKYTDAVLMDFGSVGAAIATPELLVKIDAGKITANPMAGTKTRGQSAADNHLIAKALLNDRKELAEHTLALLQMLTELQPHCEPETLVVNRLLDVIQQKDIMHLSSELSGELAADKHCIDAMLSLFPSAMVSGVPKAESIALLRQLERFPRGLFGGTVGWVSGRDCRFALTIRGIYKYGSRLFVQAGAGVMAESDPAQENEEVRMKMSAMLKTLSAKQNNVFMQQL